MTFDTPSLIIRARAAAAEPELELRPGALDSPAGKPALPGLARSHGRNEQTLAKRSFFFKFFLKVFKFFPFFRQTFVFLSWFLQKLDV